MKRKVRITPPASNPFESNSMSTWMAQLGGPQLMSDEQITSIAAEMLSAGYDQEAVKQTLSSQGYPLARVNEVIDALVAYVDEQRDLSEATYLDDQLTQDQILADQEASEMAALEDESNGMYYAPDFDPGYAEEDATMQEVLMKYGGKVPTKKQFIKQELKRKQEGGPEESNKADDTMSEKRPVNAFIQKVSAQAQQKADEEALEEQYNQMFGNQELPEAQFGGFRNPRRAQRQMNRQVNRMVRNTPMGYFNPSMQFLPSQMNFMTAPMMYPQGFGNQAMMNPGVQMANIQVTRSGLFGRPKEYTINFNTTPPSQINPREVVEQEVRNIGETVKEKEEADKEAETTTASTENETVQDELITADQIQVVDSKGKGKTTVTPQVTSTVKRDAWGRPEGDKWYGYDPDKKTFTNQVSPIKGIIDRANLAYNNSFKPASYSYQENSNDSKKTKSNPSMFNNPYLKALNTFIFQQGGVTGYDLYKFTGGGDDSMIPFADESFRTNSIDTTDPYFRDGGYFQTAGQTDSTPVEILDNNGNVIRQTTLADAEKNNLRHRVIKSNTQTGDGNRRKYDALKELGYNVGDYREGIDYSKVGQGTQRQTTTQNYPAQGGYPMMGPAGVPIYPPLFGNRGGRGLFGPGKSIQYAGSWLQQQGLPYDPRTGKPVQGLTNQQIKSIDVKKSGLISGRPKKYTINFTGQAPEGTGFGTFNTGFQPRKDWNTPYTPQAGTSSKSDQNVPGAFGPRSDEFMQNLWKNRAKRKGYDVDWSTDGMISPKDLQTVDKLPTKSVQPVSTSADELKARQTAQLDGAPAKLNLRDASLSTVADMSREPINRNFSVNSTIPMPELTDEQLAQLDQGLVDVQPEDLTQDYTALPSEIAANRNPQTVSPMVNTSGPMNNTNYSFDMPGEGENYADEYEDPYSPERNYMLESLGRGPSNMPYYPIGADAPLIGPDAASQYLNESMNYDMDLPYQTPLQQPWMTQEMVDASQRRYNQKQVAAQKELERRRREVKNDTRREVVNNVEPEVNISTPDRVDKIKNPKSKPLTQQQQIHLENQVENWDEYQKSGLDIQQYLYLKNTGRTIPKVTSKYDDYQKWARENKPRGTIYQQTGGVNFSYPQLPVAQTLGQFNMRTPSSNRNYATMPSAEDMMQQQTPMGQFANYQNPLTGASPAIRMGSEGEYINEGLLTDEDLAKLNQRDMSIDAKVKNMYNVDFEKGVNQTNAGIGLGLSMFGQVGDIANNKQLNANLTSGNVYNAKNQLDKGDWTQWGQFRPDRVGFKDDGMTTRSQKGGSMYKEGGETYMSAKQITDFLANGGEIEFV